MRKDAAGETFYRYNYRNQLVEVKSPDGEATYAYDAIGRRIYKNYKGTTTHYTWAGQQLISEVSSYRGAQQSRVDYLWHPEMPVPLAMRVGGYVYYIHTGIRSEPLCMTDRDGKVVWFAEYDAFGRAKILVNEIRQPFRLAGQYFDEETDLHYNLARYYDPRLGRYLTRDPLFEEGGGCNFYTYCDGDPINRLDPEGEFIFTACLIGAGIGALIGGGVEWYRQKKAIERGEQKGYDGWGIAKGAAVGGVIGAVGGGVGAAVEGAFAAGVTATVAGGAGVGGLSGAVSSIAEQCTEAAITGQKLNAWDMTKQTLTDGLVGMGIGAVTGGVGGFLARRAKKGASEIVDQATKKIKPKTQTPKTNSPKNKTPSPPKSAGELFEENVKNTFKNKIIRKNEILRDKTGKVIGEIDFETSEALVEVGRSLNGKTGQLHKLAEEAAMRGKRLDVIYGPDTPLQRLNAIKESLRKKWGNRVRFIPHGD